MYYPPEHWLKVTTDFYSPLYNEACSVRDHLSFSDSGTT